MISTTLRLPAKTTRAQLMVGESANILKRFYLIQRELVLMQAGWMLNTAHWERKLLLPEFLWQDALVARELRQRVLELRYPFQREGGGGSVIICHHLFPLNSLSN